MLVALSAEANAGRATAAGVPLQPDGPQLHEAAATRGRQASGAQRWVSRCASLEENL